MSPTSKMIIVLREHGSKFVKNLNSPYTFFVKTNFKNN